MWNEPTLEQFARLPKLYETEKVRLNDGRATQGRPDGFRKTPELSS